MRASYALPGIFEPVRVNGRWLYDGALVNPVPVTVCRALGADLVIAANLIGDNAYRGRVITDHIAAESSLQTLAEAGLDADQRQSGEPRKNRFFGDMGSNLRRQFGKRPDGAPGIASAMLDAFNITQGRISRSRLAGDPPDLMINARLGKVGLFDFHRADELIAIGREATLRIMPDIIDCLAIRPESGDASPP
jgi:NTE family protein